MLLKSATTNDARLVAAPVLGAFILLDVLIFMAVAPGVDWAPLWAGGQTALADPSRLYDFEYITSLQEPLFGPLRPRPFIHPPSALLIAAPLALLPFLMSLAVFVGLSASTYLWVCRRIGAGWSPLLFPAVILAGLAGQTTLVVAALAILGLHHLRLKPVQGGMLMGAAALIKPTTLLLVPIALIARRRYRALWAWLLTGLFGVLASLLLFGASAWLAWFRALQDFQALFFASPSLLSDAITPLALTARAGIDAWLLLLVWAGVAIALTWIVFRRELSIADQMIALFGGALFMSPYSMDYELAVLVPAAVLLWRPSVGGSLLVLGFGASIFFGLGFFALAGMLLTLGYRLVHLARRQRRAKGLGEPCDSQLSPNGTSTGCGPSMEI
jgi:hypothetical protein